MNISELKLNFQYSLTDGVNDFADQAFQTLKWTFFFLSPLNKYVQKVLNYFLDLLFESVQQ